MAAATSSSLATLPPPAAVSGWACLPCDILLDIFLRVGHRDVLLGAGVVCAAWWRLARDEPALWRRIDPTLPDDEAILCDDACHLPHWLFDEDAAAADHGYDQADRDGPRRCSPQRRAVRGFPRPWQRRPTLPCGQLLGNSFTRDVLLRIISACPKLKSLDIRELDVDQWDQHLRKKCSRIDNVSLPFPSFYIDEESDEEVMAMSTRSQRFGIFDRAISIACECSTWVKRRPR
ncbi:hypothetical protein EJB05_01752, partial [Eragrostis curvula]